MHGLTDGSRTTGVGTCGNWTSADSLPGLVSVIIPTYNRESMVVEAIRSALDQTHENVEVIVVDDGSTDNTAEAVEKVQRGPRGDRVRYFRQENSGPGPARNRGLMESRGEFIQFLDSDDLLLPTKLQKQARVMRNKATVDVVLAKVLHRETDGDSVKERETGDAMSDPMEVLLAGTAGFRINGPLWRRRVCIRGGPWKDLRVWEDWECYVRYLLASSGSGAVDEPLAVVRRIGQDTLCTRTVGRRRAEILEEATRHVLATLSKLPTIPDGWKQALAAHFFKQARYALACGATDIGLGRLRSACVLAQERRLRMAIRYYMIAGRILGWRGVQGVGRSLRRFLPRALGAV